MTWPAVVFLLLLAAPVTANPAALARARQAYNEDRFDVAITEATAALSEPALADTARLVLARAHLERYRHSAEPTDLSQARNALRAIDPSRLTIADQSDLLVGLGEWLFFNERFGAAAQLFDDALSRPEFVNRPAGAHDGVLDWWATAMDRHAQQTPARRDVVYSDMVERLRRELRRDAGSAPANYWLVVATRGLGDLDQAWQAAMAAWIRAGLSRDRGASLRADVDRFVLTAIIPDRARGAAQGNLDGRQAAADAMVADWERFKAEWEQGGG
jgi:hypothetical protein